MITELVPCGNPKVKQLLEVQSRSLTIGGNFTYDVRDGVKYCSWCWVKPFKHPRQSYCSDECRESCNLFCYPQTEAGLHFIIMSRGSHCESCGYSWAENIEAARAVRIQSLKQSLEMYRKYEKKSEFQTWIESTIAKLEKGQITRCLISQAKSKIDGKRKPEIDHIIPVALGGTTLGFENLQVLCSECHKTKTKKDMNEIRESRREK